MEKLTVKKRLSVVMSYFHGLSYDEIAAKAGVSKGTVANIIADLKAGSFPEAGDVGDQIELLRDLSLDLRRLNLSPGQCATGLILLNRINECGLDPAHIDRWPMVLKAVPNQEDAKEFVRSVYAIQEVQKRTGLDLGALDDKIHEVERKTADLESTSNKVKDCRRELSELTKQREKLVSAVALFEQKNGLLGPRVKDLEEREQTLSQRIAGMEPRAQKAETTLSALRSEIQKLKDMGFSPKELAKFNEKLQVIAEHHTIKPTELRSRLLHELENLDKGLGLETLVEGRQRELDKATNSLATIQNKIEAARVVVDSLQQEKMNIEVTIRETREKVSQEIGMLIPMAQQTIDKLGQDLRLGTEEALAEMRQLKDEAMEVGREVGRSEGILQVNQWLKELMALVRGEDGVEGKRVRVIALSVLRALHVWLERQHSTSLTLLPLTVKNLISELERWQP
jgi:predicted  nucleic acid-binding Zn-ribbon protein